MPLTLHAALVPGWLQILGSVRQLIDKAEAHCREHGLAPQDLIDARLAPDMMPFAKQIMGCASHSADAVKSALTGSGSPNLNPPPATFADLAAHLDQATGYLAALDPAELEAALGREVVFTIGDRLRLEFTAENFLLGFSQPNFYFHATTAYDILRMKGLSIGKRDFIGALPVRA